MELKGNIKVEEVSTDVDTVGSRNLPQIKVTKTYRLSGVDLSQGESDTGDDDNDASRADELVDDAKKELSSFFTDFYSIGGRHEKNPAKSGDPYSVVNSEAFVGLDCDVTVYSVETLADLKSCQIDLEISAFYDVPINSIESAISHARVELLGHSKIAKKQ